MLRGFKDFVARGNVVDLAVGVIIGAAFGAIVDSLVKDVITPAIGLVGGQPDFSTWKAGPIAVGNFLNAIVAFLLKAAGLYFLIVLPVNRYRARQAAIPSAPPAPTAEEKLLGEIRDLLAKRA